MYNKIALVFPGQGSQSVGILSDWSNSKVVRETFEEARDALGYDIWTLLQEGPVESLNQTIHTQPAILTASIALWRDVSAKKALLPAVLAGHSLGEYTALVVANSLSFEAALKLVRFRAQCMQEAVPEGEGAMSVILGLKDDQVIALCEEIASESESESESVEAANFNAPGQVVIAGHHEAVLRAMTKAKSLGAKRTLLLPMSVPSHCRLMCQAAQKLAEALNTVPFKVPSVPVIQNAEGVSYEDPHKIREALVNQLVRPVNWVRTIEAMEDLSVETFIECGPGSVLTGLNKRIFKRPKSLAKSLQNEEVVC